MTTEPGTGIADSNGSEVPGRRGRWRMLAGVRGELASVTWPSRRQVAAQTGSVLGFVTVMVAGVGLFDAGSARIMLDLFTR